MLTAGRGLHRSGPAEAAGATAGWEGLHWCPRGVGIGTLVLASILYLANELVVYSLLGFYPLGYQLCLVSMFSAPDIVYWLPEKCFLNGFALDSVFRPSASLSVLDRLLLA